MSYNKNLFAEKVGYDYANKKMITNSIFLPFNQNYNYVTENLEANYDNPLSM